MTYEQTEQLELNIPTISSKQPGMGDLTVYIKHRVPSTNSAIKKYLTKLQRNTITDTGNVNAYVSGLKTQDAYTYFTIEILYGTYMDAKQNTSISSEGFNTTSRMIRSFIEYSPILSSEPTLEEQNKAKQLFTKTKTTAQTTPLKTAI